MIPILNAATVEALSGSDDASDRRLIRKSDSPATVVKNILKIASALSTFGKVLGQAGLAPWLAILSFHILLAMYEQRSALPRALLFAPHAR